MLEVLQTTDLHAAAVRKIRWLWTGYLAEGMVTLLTSRWKAGKTTLVSAMLRLMEQGGSLAGSEVAPGRAVIVSEEPPALWAQRDRSKPFGPQVSFICRPFKNRPSPEQWSGLIDQLAEMPVEVVILDPLAMFLPGSIENSASPLLGALEQLHRLTDRGMAVILLHHPRKEQSVKTLSPRGSGALTGFADFIAELDGAPEAGATNRRRRLRVASRLSPPCEAVIELDEAGLMYSLVETAAEPDGYEAAWPVLEIILGDAPYRLTRDHILSYWLEDHEKPSMPTLRRWLERAEQERRVEKTGTGRKFDPFKFTIAGRADLMPELPVLETWRTQATRTHNMLLKADRVAARALEEDEEDMEDEELEDEYDEEE
jgi:hypothetical protein